MGCAVYKAEHLLNSVQEETGEEGVVSAKVCCSLEWQGAGSLTLIGLVLLHSAANGELGWLRLFITSQFGCPHDISFCL